MNLSLDNDVAHHYRNRSQIARVLTELWVLKNIYCPQCGTQPINQFDNNKPVADFYCPDCLEQFELKSKSGRFSGIINDGAYATMLQRINSENNPNLLLLEYDIQNSVTDFFSIPKQFLTPDNIIKRKPLSDNARRAGWIGCNIDISGITEAGKIYLIKDKTILSKSLVIKNFSKTLFLRNTGSTAKGWLLEILRCLDLIDGSEFSLKEIYNFETSLRLKYTENNHIKDKIRQQLQILRDNNIIEFLGSGYYRKL